MHSWSGHSRQIKGLGSNSISWEGSVGCMWRANGMSMLRAIHISSHASRAVLVRGGDLGYLALQCRLLLLGSQDVPYVVRCPSSNSVGRSYMVRRDSGRVHCRVEARVLREVVAPVSLMHSSRAPVHPWTSGVLRVHRIFRMPEPARIERRWCSGVVKLHPSEFDDVEQLDRISSDLILHTWLHTTGFCKRPSWSGV